MSSSRNSTLNPRTAQLRNAKRRQRQRDKGAGLALYQLRLESAACERLKTGMRDPGFVARFHAFLEREVIRVNDFPNLALLCWNRNVQYLAREDAFRLYEGNWRLVDRQAMDEREQALVHELTHEFGGGLLNA